MTNIGIVGAGMMGTEIALVFATSGFAVKIFDEDSEKASTAPARIQQIVDKLVTRGIYQPEAAKHAGNVRSVVNLQDFADCDIVVEAVFEDIEVKGAVYAALQKHLKAEAILITNTSSISITALGGRVQPELRERFIGAHFFSPVSRMKLVEVIPGIDTTPTTVEQVTALMHRIGKHPIPVKDVVGFAVNRLLHIFFIEAMRLVEEGAATPEDIDTACKLGLGHPVGPFELMDATSTRLGLQVQQILRDYYGDRFLSPQNLKGLVAAGYHGRAAGRGWYKYINGKRA